MNLEICGMMQETDFASGEVGNFLVLALPDGTRFRALVTDEVASTVLSHVLGTPPVKSGPALKEPELEQVFQAAEEVTVFGGDVPARKAPKIKTVVKDDMGYPIVIAAGAVDPSVVVGGQASDEDEAGQI